MLDPVLEALYGRLSTGNTKQGLELDATTLGTDGSAILALIGAALGGATSIPLAAGATVERDDVKDRVHAHGSATQTFVGAANLTVDAEFSTTSDAQEVLTLEAVLTLTPAAGWSFTASFPELAGTLPAQLSMSAPAFVLRSFDGPADGYGPVEHEGLNLEVGVAVAGSPPLAELAPVLSLTGVDTLAMKGPVGIAAAGQTVSLRAASGQPPVQMPVTGLQDLSLASPAVVVTATAAPTTAGQPWSTGAALQVWGQLTFGGSKIPLGVEIPVGIAPWTVFVVPGLGTRLGDLVGFVPGFFPIDALPEQLKNAVNVEITTFSLTLDYDESQWHLDAAQIVVDAAAPWTLVPGAIEIEDMEVGLDVSLRPPRPVSGWVNGTIELGGETPIPIGVSVPIPLSAGPISVWSNPNVAIGLESLAGLVGGSTLTDHLPASVVDIGGFRLSSLSATIDPAGPTIEMVSVGLTAAGWTVVPDAIALEGIDIGITVTQPFSKPGLSGHVSGFVDLGTAQHPLPIYVMAQRPDPTADWTLEVAVRNISLTGLGALDKLGGGEAGTTLPPTLQTSEFVLTELELDADLSKRALQRFQVGVAVDNWNIAPGYFDVEQIAAAVVLDWTSGAMVASGSIMAVLVFGDEVDLQLSAERGADGHWVFAGKLLKPIKIGQLVTKALHVDVPDHLADVDITELALTYRTAADSTGDSYDFAAAADWKPQFGGISLDVDARVALHRAPDPKKAGASLYSGHIEGDLKSHFGTDQLELSVAYEFGSPSQTSYVFKLTFNDVTLQATLAAAANGDNILTVHLGGVTFGEIVEFLVNLVDPSLHFELDAPWDVLNKISFDKLSLTMNLTQRTVGITYDVGENLGIIDIETISLTYGHKGGSSTVDIAVTGSFLDQKYTQDQPLQWDMLNDPPPATPGAGAKMFDLQELAVGQHLVISDKNADTMPKVLADVHDAIVTTKGKHPWDVLKFDPTAGWLFGAKFTVMDTVTLGVIFDDPVMYGAEITLAGPKAGSFAGLDFQILYRKISDTIGEYHVELKLPDAFRHLEFGEVSITLPIVVLDVYTDGGFYFDFGFPYGGDWTVCFGVEVFPFVGSGGFYIGKLSAAEGGDLVPAISNGTFNPIIEFGVALSLGVGKDIEEGPFSAGLSLTVQGILTGVVAFFNPSDTSQQPDRYYKIDGSVAIVGKLYGRVDFKIITIDISVLAEITATLDVIAYGPIQVALSVEVEVEASIKIIFFRIHFSFALHLDASFTIGSAHPTPWQLVSGAPPPQQGAGARANLTAARRSETAHRMLLGAPSMLAMASSPHALQWSPAAVMDNGALVALDLTLTPILTASGASVEVVVVPLMQTSAPTDPVSAEGLQTAVAPLLGQDPATLPFNGLVKALLRWGMQTRLGTHAGLVTQTDLHQIYLDLTSDAIGAHGGGFAYPNLVAFLNENIVLTAGVPPATDPGDMSGAVLPIMPPLWMTQNSTTVHFDATVPVDGAWQQKVSEIFSGLLVNYDYNRSGDPLAQSSSQPVFDPEPIAEALFSDWFVLVAKGAFQAAIDALAKVTHTPVTTDSLATLAATYAPTVHYTPRTGDTLAGIAALFGIPTSALVAANKGKLLEPLTATTVLDVPPPQTVADYVVAPGDDLDALASVWGTTGDLIQQANPGVDFGHALVPGSLLKIPVPTELFAIADANLDAPLGPGPLPLPGIAHRVQAAETLDAIAGLYGLADPTGLAAANAGDPSLLRAGSSLTIGPAGGGRIPYKVANDDTLDRIAAFAYVRNLGPFAIGQDDPNLAWFANAISQANPHVQFAAAPVQVGMSLTTPNVGPPVPAGTSLTIPNVALVNGMLQPANPATVEYATKQGDTLDLIAAYFLMTELGDDDLSALKDDIQKNNANITPGTTITIEPLTHAIGAGDTLEELASAFGLQVFDLATVNAKADMLRPNASLVLPLGFSISGAGKTLTTLAALAGLTVDGLVSRLGATQGLFDVSASLQVPGGWRAMDVDALQGLLVSSGATNNVASQASNFMVHGLQLPDPADTTYKTFKGLYELTQQQFAAPDESTASYPITFGAPPGTAWLALPNDYTPQSGETLADIAGKFGTTVAVLDALNPGIDPNTPAAPVVVPGSQLEWDLTTATMQANWPSTTLEPQVIVGPTRTVLAREAPAHHAMGAQSQWSAAASPTLAPATASPQSALFPLPADVVAKAAAPGAAQFDYTLMTVPKGQPTADGTKVGTYSWATWVPFTIRRIAAPGGVWLAGSYGVLGAGDDGADALLGLWSHLSGGGDGAQLFLLHPPAAGGLLSDALDTTNTALLKADLSTETHGGPQLTLDRGVVGGPAAYAPVSSQTDFLGLLWEASVTGTGGFFLTYATTTGAALPDSLFGSGDEVQITLLALLNGQTQPSPDRTVHPFTTGAVAAAGIDPSKVSVFAESSDPTDVVTVTTAPPGNVGFSLARTNPSSIVSDTTTSRTQKLYSLLAFTIAAGGGFDGATEALPIGPTKPTDISGGLPADAWYYHQTIAAFRLASHQPAQLAPGLPDATANPYAGIGAGAAVSLGLEFRDLFGNELTAGSGLTLTAPFGYYDPVIGLSAWPGASGMYSFAGPDAHVVVDVDLGMARYVPGTSVPFAAAVRTAAAHANTYAQISYQLEQGDVKCAIETSLDQPGTPCLSGAAVEVPLRAFVMATCLYLGTAQDVQQVVYTAGTWGKTLQSVATLYDTTVAAVIEANSAADLSKLVDGALTVPQLYVVKAGDTLAAIATATSRTVPQLVAANQNIPLVTGAGATGYQTRAGDTLRSIAALENVAIGDIGIANAGAQGILDTTVQVTFHGNPVTIGANDTFGTLAGRLGTTPAVLAVAWAGTPLFLTGVDLAIPSVPVLATASRTYTTRAGDTPTIVAALMDVPIADVGTANTGNPGILDTTAKVTFDGKPVTIGANDTFGTLAGTLGTTPAVLAVAWAGTPLFLPNVPIAIASASAKPGDPTGARTVTVGSGNVLADVATANSCTVAGIALANGQAKLLTTGCQITVRGTTVPVGADGTFLGVVDALAAPPDVKGVAQTAVNASLADVAVAAIGTSGLLVARAELTITDYVVSVGQTLAAVVAAVAAAGFTLDSLAVLDAAAPANVFATGTPLLLGTTSYTPNPGDSFAGVAADAQITLDQLAAANDGTALSSAASVAVPGVVELGQTKQGAVYVPADAATPTLGGVAEGVTGDAGQVGSIATLNADMPGLVAPNVTIDYPGHAPVQTDSRSTLESLRVACGAPDVATFASDPSVRDLAGLVAAGALIVTPLAHNAGTRSLDDIATGLGVDPVDLATANSALVGLVNEGFDFVVAGQSVTADANDTLQSIVARLQAGDPAIDLAALVTACGSNAQALATADLIVPPPRISISAPVADPYVASSFAALSASVTIARDPTLVDPGMSDPADVIANTTALAPELGTTGGLAEFAASFEAAFAARRLKLGAGPQPSIGTRHLYAVDFGAQGFAQIAVDGSPHFYALAPISQQLASGSAPVQPYVQGNGLGPVQQQAFRSIDLDAWLRSALEAIDLVLSPPYAAALWRLSATAYADVVSAKSRIATGLRGQVLEILQSSADTESLAAAQDALYQSMLSSLATAYTTDALIQFPVKVQSPFSSPYTTGATDQFTEPAAHYGVSPEGFAQGLADVPDVLATGVVVTATATSTTYTIQAGDTLRTLATQLQIADVTDLPGATTVQAGQGLFAASTSLEVSSMERSVATGDTFQTLAAFFGADPGAVGAAAQDVPGLIVPGTVIGSYTVGQQDKLRHIAQQVGSTAAAVASSPAVIGKPVLVAQTPVQCISTANPIAPRLSGKAIAGLYTVQSGDGLSQLVTYYQVSQQTLADALQSLNRIVAVGTTVEYPGGKSYEIGAADTLKSIAAATGAPSVLDLLQKVSGLLLTGANIPLGRVAYAPTAADTFQSIADYFNIDPGTLATANQDTSGVLLTGVTLKVGNKSHPVASTDTLTDVAQALGVGTAADLALLPEIVLLPAIFNAQQAVHDLQPTPDVSLSTAQTSLASGTAPVTFLFGTSADAAYKSLFLDLDYQPTEVELQIEPVPGMGAYQESEWLRFPVALGSEAFGGAVSLAPGQTDVPIPLRAYPMLPSILTQAGTASDSLAGEIATAKQWRFDVDVQHQSAAQDEMRVMLEVGRQDSQTAPSFSEDAVFQALAQFTSVWPALQHDLAQLPTMTPSDSTLLGKAVGALDTIATMLAEALDPQKALSADFGLGNGDGGAEFCFQLDNSYDYDKTPPELDMLDLTLLESKGDMANVPWPAIFVDGHGLHASEAVSGSKRYTYPAGIAAFGSHTYHFTFPETGLPGISVLSPPDNGSGASGAIGFDAIRWQYATATACVLRNADLVSKVKTADAFVYQTPWVGFVNPAVPLIENSVAMDIGPGPVLLTPMTTALTQALTAEGSLLTGAYDMRIQCRYAHTLSGVPGDPDSIVTYLPVLLAPLVSVTSTSDGITAVATTVSDQASTWLGLTGIVPVTGDQFVIDMTIYASTDQTHAKPLVELSNLTVAAVAAG